jgi:hypothetical protein
VQHAGKREVLDVHVPAGALRRDVRPQQWFADGHVLRGRRQRRVAIDFQREESITNERSDSNAGAARARPHFAVDDGEVGDGTIQPCRAHLQQCSARRGRGRLNFRTAANEARAAAGPTLVRTACCVALDHGHARWRDAKFLGGHLREGDADARADIDLARVERDGSVRVNREQAVDFA